MKKTMIAALLGATLLTGGALAAVGNTTQPQDTPPARQMRDPMLMADANKDGIVTRDETIAAVTARFAKLDADKDGKITREEHRAARAALGPRGERMDRGPGGPGMRKADGDRDGVITLDDQRTRALRLFDFVDRNSDGRVDQAERKLVAEMLREFGGPGRGRGHHGRQGPRHGGEMPPPPPPGAPEAPGNGA